VRESGRFDTEEIPVDLIDPFGRSQRNTGLEETASVASTRKGIPRE
jgi:hypothetical protein